MNNLKKLREAKGVSQQNVADYLGISRQAYSYYELGKRQADYETLLKLSEYFESSIERIINENAKEIDTAPVFKYDNILPVTLQKIPMLGAIACGEPIYANEDKESYVMADSDIKADFCLRAKGDSMINARIYDGDLVFIRQQEIVDNGDIAAVIIDDEATLKRVYYYPEKNKLILNPENPKYEPFVYMNEELDEIRILGKAVYFMSAL